MSSTRYPSCLGLIHKMSETVTHTPVLSHEVVEHLAPRAGSHIVDGTVGGGGHARLLLETAGAGARLTGIDRDPYALARASETLAPFGTAVQLIHGSFGDAAVLVDAPSFKETSAVLVDLGVSSFQIDDPARGFRYLALDAPLDMRMDTSTEPRPFPRNPRTPDDVEGCSAAEILAHAPEPLLAQILAEYGEIRPARRLAAQIVHSRAQSPIATTGELVRIVHLVLHPNARTRHPEAPVFQALRIAVNGELRALERFLATVPPQLPRGARIGVISFHSLEDRMVKQSFRDAARSCICPPAQPLCSCGGNRSTLRLLTRRAIQPTEEEIAANPRARSARLRVAEIC